MNNKIENLSFARSQIIVLPIFIFLPILIVSIFIVILGNMNISPPCKATTNFFFFCYTMPTIPNNVSLN